MKTMKRFIAFNVYGTEAIIIVELNKYDTHYEIKEITKDDGKTYVSGKNFDCLSTAQLKYLDTVNNLIIYA